MSDPTDIDALIAKPWEYSKSEIVSALEHSQAELRQEREQEAYWENEYETAEDMKTELRAALSRAEETIEEVLELIAQVKAAGEVPVDVYAIERLLTEGTGQPTNHEIRRQDT